MLLYLGNLFSFCYFVWGIIRALSKYECIFSTFHPLYKILGLFICRRLDIACETGAREGKQDGPGCKDHDEEG